MRTVRQNPLGVSPTNYSYLRRRSIHTEEVPRRYRKARRGLSCKSSVPQSERLWTQRRKATCQNRSVRKKKMSSYDERIKQGKLLSTATRESMQCARVYAFNTHSHLCLDLPLSLRITTPAIPAEFHMISGSHDMQTSGMIFSYVHAVYCRLRVTHPKLVVVPLLFL